MRTEVITSAQIDDDAALWSRWFLSARGRVAHLWRDPAPRTLCGRLMNTTAREAEDDARLCQRCTRESYRYNIAPSDP